MMSTSSSFQRLFEPITVGSTELPNRVVALPLITNLGSPEGYVTEQAKAYYEERARGGAGLVIVEAAAVEYPLGRRFPNQLSISDDRFLPGLRELSHVVHRHGAKAAIQLHHAGGVTTRSLAGAQPVAASAISVPTGEPARELTIAEIKGKVSLFARAARLAREAGFDGVDIPATGAYLVCEFLSRAWNKRDDEYGGSLSNRARFLLEITEAIKRAAGEGYPTWFRLLLGEYGVENGITLEETLEVAKLLEHAGVAAINTSILGFHAHAQVITPETPGEWLPLVEKVKRAVRIPVIAFGRMEPAVAERALQEGKADLIGIGRGLVADPHLPAKTARGKLEDIRPCIGCLRCMETTAFKNESIRCSVNASAGRESEYRLIPASRSKRVVVVGGGAAGMEAATVAASRGHKVTLFEKDERLGGQMVPASIPPNKGNIEPFVRYMSAQLEKAGVQIKLRKEFKPQSLQALNPDALVLASGVEYVMPDIPGVERIRWATATDVLMGRAASGKRVVVIGGNMVGAEVAEWLANQGKEVSIIEVLDRIAAKVMPVLRRPLLARLAQKGVKTIVGVQHEEVVDGGLLVLTRDGRRQTIEADMLVIAAGARPSRRLLRSLEGKVSEMHLVGDCREPRSIADAIADGVRIGLSI